MRRAVPWRAWSAWLLAVASLMLVFVLFIWHNDALPATNMITWVLGSFPSLAFVTVGAVVVARRPGNRIGWLCYGVGLGQILAGFGSQAAASALAADPSSGPVWLVVYELGELCWELSWALLALLLLLFPNGQLPSPRWRPVISAAGAVLVLATFSAPFLSGPPAPGLPPNPIAIPALEGVLRLAYASAGVVLVGVILAALVSLVVQFRRARGVERQQLKWSPTAPAYCSSCRPPRSSAPSSPTWSETWSRPPSSRRSRSRSAWRCCAIGCTTSTGSSAARWSMGS